jgi:hypothetical protein
MVLPYFDYHILGPWWAPGLARILVGAFPDRPDYQSYSVWSSGILSTNLQHIADVFTQIPPSRIR